MRPGGGDRVERQIAQHACLLAGALQRGRSGELGLAAFRRRPLEPAQEPDLGRAVAGLGVTLPLLFARVLHRLGQNRRIAHGDRFRTRLGERVEDRRDAEIGIDRDALARQFAERRLELGARPNRHRVAEVLRQFGRYLLRRDEQFGGAVVMGDHIAQRHRRAVHVRAADVEQPGDRIERTDHRRVIAFALEPVGDLRALVGARSAGEFVRLHDRRGRRGLGPVGPHRIDRIAVHGNQFGPLRSERLRDGVGPAFRMEPWIETDPGSFRCVGGEPFGRAGLRNRLIIEQLAVDLLAHLHGVAAVDEDRRLVLQYHRGPRRTAEPGQPGEAFGVIADVFAHVLVGDRDHKAVEPATGQFLPQGVEAGFMGLHQHGLRSFRQQHRAARWPIPHLSHRRSRRRSPPASLITA